MHALTLLHFGLPSPSGPSSARKYLWDVLHVYHCRHNQQQEGQDWA